MSILITRPYNIGINSQNKISKLGKKSLLIPLIKIKYLNIEISDIQNIQNGVSPVEVFFGNCISL